MFWLSSETEVTLRQSFSDIATQLKLPNATPNDHEHNRTLALNWLQTTGSLPVELFLLCPWLD